MSSARTSLARIPAIDAVRGLAIVLMALDHARGAFDAAHFHGDSFVMWRAGDPLPTVSFLARWITHFCAPAFLFTMGVGVALRCAAARARGIPDRQVDRTLIRRGILFCVLDPLWMWWAFAPDLDAVGGVAPVTGIQVLFALGFASMALAGLRRFPARRLALAAVVTLVAFEGVLGLVMHLEGVDPKAGRWPSTLATLLLSGGFGFGGRVAVIYPLLAWLPFAVLGFACGHRLAAGALQPAQSSRTALRYGLLALGVFFVVRAFDGYGNVLLYRGGWDPLRWLHVSKYPPSLSYAALELGLVGLAFALALRVPWQRWPNHPLLVFGRNPLLFYLVHVHLLTGAALLLGRLRHDGLATSALAAALLLALLYPCCRFWERRPRRSAT